MLYRRPLLTALAFVMAFVIPLEAQEARFTTEIALDVGSPQVAAMTEDGARVAVVVRTRRGRVDTDHMRFGDPTYVGPSLATAMVIDTRTGLRTWLHEQPAQVDDFTWSKDGTKLAYLAFDGAAFSLHVFDAGPGSTREVRLRTNKSIASSSPLVWSPDGRTLLLTLRPDGWAERASEAFHALTDAPIIVQDSRDDFLAWDRVRNIANEQTTALVTVSDGAVRELLTDVVPQGVGFSPDGARLTYTTSVRTKTSYSGRDGTDYGLYALTLDGSEPVELVAPSEERVTARWNDARDAYAFTKEGAVWVHRLGDEEGVDVTEGHRTLPGDTAKVAYSVERWSSDGRDLFLTSSKGWHVLHVAAGDLQTVFALEEEEDERPRRSVEHWSEDGRYVFFSHSAADRWERGLKRLDVATGEVEDVLLDANVYRGWSFSTDASSIVYSMSDGDRPEDVWAVLEGAAAPIRLTELNPQLDDVAVSRTELVEYLDLDGNTLYGILYYPIDYDPSRKYPLVAEIYEQFFDNGFNENMNIITAQGWFGFRPSVQFEEGYPAEAWLKAVPSAINKLIDRGLVDEDQLGVYGQSYGGYAANLLITQTDRFAAAANVSGKVNIISFLGDSPKITTRNYAAAENGQDRIGATLWEQPQKYIDHSAVMFADRIDTPLLMLSGEGDWNVPATNQREMYYALRRLEKEVVWVHYTAGGHGAGRASSVADFHDHWQRMVSWFAEHFKGDGAAAVS
ncbi:MAG: prolyl oligopeptidase family serine peptidase [Gemmatimonadetes bacterium]|nr:prolyl oligopeptidase family serine peptidase [Gemmatimonadota bacterium]MDA1104522.1 prolyl oligopeptidase family serine peptidase [Gemmatimonadota bacterium]